jgi:hypothetical protein
MNQYNIEKDIKVVIFLLYITFAFLAFIIFLLQYNSIDGGLVYLQAFYILSFVLCFLLGMEYNKSASVLIIFIYQIICTVVLFFYNDLYVGDPFSYSTIDSITYQNIFERTKYGTISELIDYLKNGPRLFLPSDWGYPVYRYFIGKLVADNKLNFFLVCVCNACLHTVSSIYVYKLSCYLIDKTKSKIVLLFWGLNTISIYSNSNGLKETIFTLFVVLAVYHLYVFNAHKTIHHFLLMSLFVCATWFFRFYISLFIILTFFGYVVFKKIFNRYYLLLIILAFILGLFALNILTIFIPELSYVSGVFNMRLNKGFGNNGLFSQLLNFFFAFISPFPAYSVQNTTHQILFSAYSIMKVYFSFFAIYGIYHAINIQDVRIYPLIMIVILNIILCITSGFSIDYRFAYPTSFLYMILMLYGFGYFMQMKICFLKKIKINKSIIQTFLFSVCIGITILYNFR